MLRRSRLSLVIALAVACVAGLATPAGLAGAQTPAPPPPVPAAPGGQVSPAMVKAAAADARVHIVKSTSGPSCTGYSSQSTPPSTIRVMVYGATPTQDKIVTIPFEQYVENVLPNEWISSWDGESLKAGAVAAKSYAWYWVTHFGGYLDARSNCFDVTDQTDFQRYIAGTATVRTNNAVQATWSVVARKGGQVLQAFYICTLPYPQSPPQDYCATNGAKEKCGASANGTQLSQYGSQACAEANKTYQQILAIYYGSNLELATTSSGRARLLIPNDFNFQGHSNAAVFDPTTGTWTVNGDTSTPLHFGTAGDIPTVTNAGDGWATIGVFRPASGTWYTADIFSGQTSGVQWGTNGDIPVQAHYRGISQPTVRAVFRPSLGTWYLYQDGPSIQYGAAGDIPTPGHYAGNSANDYADQVAVFRPSDGTWYMRGVGKLRWGTKGDIPTPGDYNGDGRTDPAIYRPSTQTWYIYGSAPVQWGAPGDIPVTGDFNGDGKTDIATFRPSNGRWYVRGQGSVVLGTAQDIPIGRAPYTD